MDLRIELIGNSWINAGIVGFYEFYQKFGQSNSDIKIKSNLTGLTISGDEEVKSFFSCKSEKAWYQALATSLA